MLKQNLKNRGLITLLIGMVAFLNGCGKTTVVEDDTFTPIRSTTDKILLFEVLYNPEGSEIETQWIELYNPTSTSVSLNGWFFKTSGSGDKLLLGSVPANGYFLIARSASGFLNKYGKNANATATFTLSSNADHVQLFNGSRELVDTVSWGGDIEEWTSVASDGESVKRHSFVDTDLPSDWVDTASPLPDN